MHVKRLEGLFKDCQDKIIFGGKVNISDRYIAPTVVGPLNADYGLMKTEVGEIYTRTVNCRGKL